MVFDHLSPVQISRSLAAKAPRVKHRTAANLPAACYALAHIERRKWRA
jgi:hypothetical protein